MSGWTDKPLGMSEANVLAGIREHIYWPLELSLSPAALHAVEMAVRAHLSLSRGGPMSERTQNELALLANTIRAHLQHVVSDAREAAAADDPLLR